MKTQKDISYNEQDGRRRPFLVSMDWLSISGVTTPNFVPADTMPSGYHVIRRGVGTKQWKYLADIHEPDGTPIGTLAWEPRQKERSPLCCQFKAENQVLYEAEAWDRVCAALIGLGIKFKNICRLDLACDFNEFFNGMLPSTLINGYMTGKYVKVGLSKAWAYVDATYHAAEKAGGLALHTRTPNFEGTKQRQLEEKFIAERNAEIQGTGLPLLTFEQAKPLTAARKPVIQSLTFGLASNPMQAILYCKSRELQEVKMKTYIVENWKRAGLDLSRPVWRVELRIKNAATQLRNIDNDQLQTISLVDLVAQEQIEALFTAYAERYFKWFIVDGHVKIQNAPRLQLFSFTARPVFRPKRRKIKRDASNYMRGVVHQLDIATRHNIAEQNNLMALHCKRVADFFRRSYVGLEMVKEEDTKQAILAGELGKPMDGQKHTDILYDGYTAERAIHIGARLKMAWQSLTGNLSLRDQMARDAHGFVDWDNLDNMQPIDHEAQAGVTEAIINSIFSPPLNIDYD